MASKKQQISGHYIYDKVLPLIDYRGDIIKKKTDPDNFSNYSSDFSPNNIKRLVISPDGAFVEYFISVKNKGKFDGVKWSANIYTEICKLEDYVPLLNCLSEDRICTSIEEVVIINNSADGRYCLDSKENDISDLIRNYNGSSGDIKDTIMNRYKRIHDFVVVNETNLNEVIDYIKSHNNEFICDNKSLNCVTTILHEDYYNSYGQSPKYYEYDRVGSPLNNYFKKVKDDFAKEEDRKLFEKIKDAKIKELVKKQSALLKVYIDLYKIGYILCGLSKRSASALTFGREESFICTQAKLYEVTGIPKSRAYVLKEKVEDKQEYFEQNIQELNRVSSTIYLNTFEYFTDLMIGLGKVSPLALKSFNTFIEKGGKSDFSTSLLIPERYNKKIEELSKYGIHFTNTKMSYQKSLINMAVYIVNIFMFDGTDAYETINKLRRKSAWFEQLGY